MSSVHVLLAIVAAGVVHADLLNSTYNKDVAWSALFYSKTAYCTAEEIKAWNCGPTCDEHPTFQLKNVYDNVSAESQALTGYDAAQNQIIVAFRGTSNAINWIYDFDFFFTPYPDPACNCQIHRGFLAEWNSYRTALLADVRALVAQYPTAPILVTGHSLGAAVSMVGGLDIAINVTSRTTIYNFGEPRVGDPAFAEWVTTVLTVGHQFRVTHARDPAPHVPLEAMGFLHAPHELWYDNNGNSTWMDCQDSGSSEDPKCSDSILPIDPFDHLLYLGECTDCHCEKKFLSNKYGRYAAERILAKKNQRQGAGTQQQQQ